MGRTIYKLRCCWERLPDWPKPLSERSKAGAFLQIMLIIVFLLVVLVPPSCFLTLVLFKVYYVAGFLVPLIYLVVAGLLVYGRNHIGYKRFRAWKRAKQIAWIPVIIWAAGFVFLIVCWVSGVWLNITLPSTKHEFPLTGTRGLAVDSNGNILILNKFYRRVQLFDKSGIFIRSWFVYIPPGSFTFTVDHRDYLHVALHEGVSLFYNHEGKLVEKEHFPAENFDKDYKHDLLFKTTDSHDNTYEVFNRLFLTGVRKNQLSGESQVLVKNKFGLWLLSMPYPGFIFLFLTLLIIGKLDTKLEGTPWLVRTL